MNTFFKKTRRFFKRENARSFVHLLLSRASRISRPFRRTKTTTTTRFVALLLFLFFVGDSRPEGEEEDFEGHRCIAQTAGEGCRRRATNRNRVLRIDRRPRCTTQPVRRLRTVTVKSTRASWTSRRSSSRPSLRTTRARGRRCEKAAGPKR